MHTYPDDFDVELNMCVKEGARKEKLGEGFVVVNKVQVKSILNKHKKRDDWFLDDYSVNPYYGCSFNCIYCYTRGSKYGENMPGELSAKVNAPEVLEKQLRRRAKKREYGIIAISTSTEPYQRVEERLTLARKILGVILEYRFPVHILTKSGLVLRDLDLLKEIDKSAILPGDLENELGQGAIINFSISTLNGELAKMIEPGAPDPFERLEAMKRCREEGFLAGISYIPALSFLSDSEEDLERMLETAREYDAAFVFVGSLTLFGNRPYDCRCITNFWRSITLNLFPSTEIYSGGLFNR